MVLIDGLAGTRPALVVPDGESWLVWGRDVWDEGLHDAAPAAARHVVCAERLPEVLRAALATLADELPGGWERWEAPFGGTAPEAAPARGDGGRGDGGHDHGGRGDGGHDHGGHGDGDDDPMAITGPASADGLVMEPLELQAGPLGVALPSGLVVRARLDGDVVAGAEVEAALRQEDATRAPDPSTPAAWAAAEAPSTVAAVERERALSHLGCLHRLARLLGWPSLGDRIHRVAGPVLAGHADAHVGVDELGRWLVGSRRLAARLRGLGTVDAATARDRGLAGPNLRASGVAADARAEDPAYAALGFEPIVRNEGDALARTVLRVQEVAQSLRLLELAPDAVPGAVIEGPVDPCGCAQWRRARWRPRHWRASWPSAASGRRRS